MKTVQDYINQIDQIRTKLPKEVEVILERSKEVVLNLIREKQLFEKGIDGLGNELKPSYTSYTVAVKKATGQKFTNVTLNDTGSFYEGFDLLFNGISVGVFSRDSKTPELVEKYGRDIFTFTIENNKILNDKIILPQLIEWVLSQIKI